MRTTLFFGVLYFGLASAGVADVQERYAELQAVPEAINDPDPLMRLAQLEAIVAEGDATKVQLALRTAFTVDDPNVRALALRAHLATYKTVILTAGIPDEVRAKIADPESKQYKGFVEFLDGIGYQFVAEIGTKSVKGVEFPVTSMNNYDPKYNKDYVGSGNVRGTTISFRAPFRDSVYYHSCSFELSEYDGFKVSGTGSCDFNNGSFPFPVSLRLF